MNTPAVDFETHMPVAKRPIQRGIVLAALMGVAAAVFWIKVPGAAFHYYSPLPAPWNAIVWITCPPFWVVRNPAWLLLLNGSLYAAIALVIQFLRKFLHPFAR